MGGREQLAFKEDYQHEIENMMEVADTTHNGKMRELADEANDLRRRAELAENSKSIALRKLREVRCPG